MIDATLKASLDGRITWWRLRSIRMALRAGFSGSISGIDDHTTLACGLFGLHLVIFADNPSPPVVCLVSFLSENSNGSATLSVDDAVVGTMVVSSEGGGVIDLSCPTKKDLAS